MRILVYCWKAYNQADIITAFRRRGHIVDTFEVELGNFEKDDSFERIFVEKLSGNNKAVSVYDAVFSVNYFPIISDLCGQFAGLKYICWTCDSPLSTMYHQSIFNEWNYIFIFDRFCYMTVPAQKKQMLSEAEATVEKIMKNFRRGLITEEERYKEVVET